MEKTHPSVSAGLDRTPLDQALAQLAALGITIAFACIVGWLTGTEWNYLNEVVYEFFHNFNACIVKKIIE